jgi:hypothetical protein
MKNKSEIIFVDSIDDDMCRILVGDSAVPADFPLLLLPDGACEGDFFLITITPRPDLKKRARDESLKLLEDLGDNP